MELTLYMELPEEASTQFWTVCGVNAMALEPVVLNPKNAWLPTADCKEGTVRARVDDIGFTLPPVTNTSSVVPT